MSDYSSRIDDLRRRVQRDPASIAFAQLAEEYRRVRQYAESVETCRAGLALHPGYLSARVTLGRALIELGELDEAQQELEHVLKSAPENLAAIRGLAEIYHRRGDLAQALAQFQAALALAPNDPELEETINELARQVAPQRRAEPADSISLEQMQSLFELHAPSPQLPADVPPSPSSIAPSEASSAAPARVESVELIPAVGETGLVSSEQPHINLVEAVAAVSAVSESVPQSFESVHVEAPEPPPSSDIASEEPESRESVEPVPEVFEQASEQTTALARLETMSLVLVASTPARDELDSLVPEDSEPPVEPRSLDLSSSAPSEGVPPVTPTEAPASVESASALPEGPDGEGSSESAGSARARGLHQIAALEQWLDAIHVTRAK